MVNTFCFHSAPAEARVYRSTWESLQGGLTLLWVHKATPDISVYVSPPLQICDADNDGLLNDQELNNFQVLCSCTYTTNFIWETTLSPTKSSPSKKQYVISCCTRPVKWYMVLSSILFPVGTFTFTCTTSSWVRSIFAFLAVIIIIDVDLLGLWRKLH